MSTARPVAFGARALKPDDQPKYLNSPETPAYIKGRQPLRPLPGKGGDPQKEIRDPRRGLSRPDRPRSVWRDECRRESRHGIHARAVKAARAASQSVSSSTTTAIDAGIKAARRAIEHLLPQDFDIKVLVLPDGKDPDDFIRENGTEAYNKARGSADAVPRIRAGRGGQRAATFTTPSKRPRRSRSSCPSSPRSATTSSGARALTRR